MICLNCGNMLAFQVSVSDVIRAETTGVSFTELALPEGYSLKKFRLVNGKSLTEPIVPAICILGEVAPESFVPFVYPGAANGDRYYENVYDVPVINGKSPSTLYITVPENPSYPMTVLLYIDELGAVPSTDYYTTTATFNPATQTFSNIDNPVWRLDRLHRIPHEED